jgi:hypothetical protein
MFTVACLYRIWLKIVDKWTNMKQHQYDTSKLIVRLQAIVMDYFVTLLLENDMSMFIYFIMLFIALYIFLHCH